MSNWFLLIIACILTVFIVYKYISESVAIEFVHTQTAILPSPVAHAANDDKPVYVTGNVQGTFELTDPLFRVSTRHALTLYRTIEIYQWYVQRSGRHSYSDKKWSRNIELDTITDGHVNRPFDYENWGLNQPDSPLGDFSIERNIYVQIAPEGEMLPLDQQPNLRIPADFKRYGDMLYRGQNPKNPQIGDTRIYFSRIPDGDISILGQQTRMNDGRFVFWPIQTPSQSVFFAKPGIYSFSDIELFPAEDKQIRNIFCVLSILSIPVCLTAILNSKRKKQTHLFLNRLNLVGIIGLAITIFLIYLSTICGIIWLKYNLTKGTLFLLAACAATFALHKYAETHLTSNQNTLL